MSDIYGYADPNDNDPGTEQPGWMDSIKKTVGGIFGGEEKPRPPAIDMARWAPVLKSAGLDEKSPEHQLLAAIAGHVNSAPIPKEPSMGQKLGGTFFNTLAAGGLRSAGASPSEAIAPSTSMVADWRNRRDLADSARMDTWKTGGSLVIPQVAQVVQQENQRKLAQAALARGNAQIFGTQPAPAAAAPGPAPTGITPAPAPDQTPGIRVDQSAPAAPPPAQAPPPPAAQPPPHGATPHQPDDWEAPKYPIDGGGTTQGNSAIKFHMPENARNAEILVRRALEENALRVGSGGAKTPADAQKALEQEANTPGSVLSNALAKDKADWQASTPFKLRQQGAMKEQENVISRNTKALDDFSSAGKAAYNNNNVIDTMLKAADESIKKGNLAVGAGNTILGPMHNILERLGLPHLSQGPYNVIKELSNRAAIEGVNEEMTNGRSGQRIIQAFMGAVPSADMSYSGFKAAGAAIQAINAYHVAAARIAEDIMSEPGAYANTRKLHAEIARRAQPFFDEAVAKAEAAMGGGGIQAKPTAQVDDKTLLSQINELAAKEGISRAEAAKRIGGSGAAPAATGGAPGATGAVPEATGGVPQRPPQSGFMQKMWDWSYPEQAAAMAKKRKQQEEELKRIDALRPMGPR